MGPIHPILGLNGLAIWAPHRSFMGVLIWSCPYGTDMGLLCAYPYRQAIIHPILSPIGLDILSHLGHLWACTYGLDRMGHIWVL